MTNKRKRFVAGNWKMNTSRSEAIALATALKNNRESQDLEVVVCPPSIWLEGVVRVLAGTDVHVGAQDCWHETSGAFTGQVSPTMVSELCSHVILGHSEHRRDASESDALVAAKTAAALAAGLTAIVCVGEDLDTRESGKAVEWVTGQVEAVFTTLGQRELSRVVVAYEPIWAIGSGRTAGADEAQEMAQAIRAMIENTVQNVSEQTRILYGGSATAGNSAEIIAQPDVDGLLVGGASLAADSFIAILDACDAG